MRKFYKLMAFLLITVAMTACSKNEEEGDLTQRIIDPELKRYLMKFYDDDLDFKLSKAEIERVTIISLYSYPEIRSVEGIEIFTNLEEFGIADSRVQTIDLSKNFKIRATGFRNNIALKTIYLPKAVEKLCYISNRYNAEVIFK